MNHIEKYAWGGVIILVGLLAASVPVFDMAEDVFVGGASPLSTLIENSPLTVLTLSIVAVGVWLIASDWDATYVKTVAKISVANVLGVGLLISLVVLVQLQLQNNLKPFIIAADAVVIGALGGVLLGIQSAKQRQATDEAAAERDRFQALFENVPNPIVGVEFVEDTPIVRAVNPAFTEVFGFDRRTIVGESLEAYIVPEDESFDPARQDQAMTSEEVDTTDAWDKNVIELRTVDGIRQFIRLTAPVERGPARDGYAIYIDVTAERQRRERLLVLGRTLRHDIRNQLNVVKLGAQKLLEDGLEEGTRSARLIEDAAGELLEISEQTHEIERQIAGESDPIPRDLVPIVRDVVESYRAEAECSITVEAPDTAYGNTTEAFQPAIDALVENAIEHNDQATPTIEVTVAETLDGEFYEVRVADDGPGIPQDQVEVFTREIKPTQTQHGEGLGLWTARWVMQNSGGELTFDANAPRGTVVTLRVPQASPPTDGQAEGTAHS